ncbi:sulfotransferase [Candidatus Villigracilis saccharophilus]|uniref:sulfotransferase n=1 Tax=Candidatus Villigracilis saccharophilus TaxID=3140684 RepID=UPI00313640D4|nr:sulfotransferase [Anaerolineales bacterium]
MNKNNPILVTGAHRSGTTWVGRMLASNPQTAYISEPLNVLHRRGVYRAEVDRWYTYITEENESKYLPAFQELLGFRYHLLAEMFSLRSQKDLLRLGRDLAVFTKGRLLKQRPLLKDPFAVFSAPWFAQKMNCQVVITIRHPGGFASSLKRLDWPFDFNDLLKQPMLMRDHLEKDRADMENMRADDIVGQSALLWRMIYRSVHATRSLFPDFKIVRHEDLSLDPAAGYKSLYESLGLTFDDKVRDTIINSSSSENPAELSKKKVHSVKLDSRANMDNWKKRLTAAEIVRIRKMTEDVSHLFYSDNEW